MITINRIYLLGFMGTGKTAVSKILAKQLGWKVYDSDAEISKQSNSSISDIFKNYGEDHFRNLETNVLKELSVKENCVISCGGGIIMRDENIEIMNNTGSTVLLKASPETIYNRLKDDTTRPLLAGNINPEYINKMLQDRKIQYDKSGKTVIVTDDKSLTEICSQIIKIVGG